MPAGPRKPKTPRLKRGIPKHIRKPVRTHARRVGEILWAWNLLYDQLFVVFWVLTKIEDHTIAHTIWHTIQSDKTHSEMMLAIAKPALANRPQLYEHVKWLTERTHDLAPFRNDAAHTPMVAVFDKADATMIPALRSARRQSIERYNIQSTAESWRRVRDDLYVLALFAQALLLRIANPTHQFGPLPHRPQLRSLPASHRSARKTSRLPGVAKQRRQRKPSNR